MDYFDLHCDTAHRMFRRGLDFSDPRLSVNAGGPEAFGRAAQVFAFWSDRSDSDAEAWRHLWIMHENLTDAAAGCRNLTVRTAVEDARLLEGDLSRLAMLRRAGFSLIGLTWSGDGPLCSAHDAPIDTGLTPLGRAAVAECLTLGLVPDLSHASHKTADQVLSMAENAGKPVCFSHSAFAALTPHSRNLTDEEARRAAALGGVIGIPFVCTFLGGGDLSAVCAQLVHAYEIGVGHAVCLGCDFDGTDDLPDGIRGVADLPKAAEALSAAGFSPAAVRRLFWENGAAFFARIGQDLPPRDGPMAPADRSKRPEHRQKRPKDEKSAVTPGKNGETADL